MTSAGYSIDIRRAEPQLIAAVRRRAPLNQLSKVVPEACGDSWNRLKQLGIKGGRNVAVYLDQEINMEIGQEVSAPFGSASDFFCSSTPGGDVVTTTHCGPYQRLGDAHHALLQWATDHGRTLAGPNWEIYGHWTEDPSQLRTDVFYLLAD
jgi:effector-binding domain-containing protein